jgi:chromosome partitioning protein
VMLGDLDRQQSARHWLALRPPQLPPIRGWEVVEGSLVRPPKGTTHLVIDTPAGLHGKRLEAVLKLADLLLVPLQPSPFDIAATNTFLQQVQSHKRADKLRLGLVAMRVKNTPTRWSICMNFWRRWARCPSPSCATPRTTPTWPHAA